MIRLSPKAAEQVSDLQRHFEDLGRPEALHNLSAALRQAMTTIEREPDAGLPAPRPYPFLAKAGRRWVKCGRYWFAYLTHTPPVIVGVFYDASNIPGRL